MARTILFLSAIFLFGCQSSDWMATTRISMAHDEPADGERMVKIGGIKWYVDYDEAMKAAKQKSLPIWLHFGENPG